MSSLKLQGNNNSDNKVQPYTSPTNCSIFPDGEAKVSRREAVAPLWRHPWTKRQNNHLKSNLKVESLILRSKSHTSILKTLGRLLNKFMPQFYAIPVTVVCSIMNVLFIISVHSINFGDIALNALTKYKQPMTYFLTHAAQSFNSVQSVA